MYFVFSMNQDFDGDSVIAYFHTLVEADHFAEKQRQLDPDHIYAISSCPREIWEVWLAPTLKKQPQQDPVPCPFVEVGEVKELWDGSYYVVVERTPGETLIETAARLVREREV